VGTCKAAGRWVQQVGLAKRTHENYNEASFENLSEASMTKTPTGKVFLSLIICCLFFTSSVWCQSHKRFFEDAPQQSENVRLVVLYPSLGDLKALVRLRSEELISVKNLTVIGLYHKMQLTDFEKSIRFAAEEGHDWIKFHELGGDLHPERLFQENALSDELFQIFANSDGLILFGGGDIPPSIYNAKTSLLTNIQTPFRSYLDTLAVFHLLGGWQDEGFKPYCESFPEYPILGLCLGCQSLNVGTGGTLFQDISSGIYGKTSFEDIITMSRECWHDNPYDELFPEEFLSSHMHKIKFVDGGKFLKEWGFKQKDTPYVYSSHHQAVQKLGKGIQVTATSLDGKVVEAIEHVKYPNVLGVQFHPESRNLWNVTKQIRFTPEDTEDINLLSFLEKNPPSLVFHKKLWSWFVQKLKASHKHRMKRYPL
jgi:putative glutamine amidotransferase